MLDKLLTTNSTDEGIKLAKQIHELCKQSPLDEPRICSVLQVVSMAQMYLHFGKNINKLSLFIEQDVHIRGAMEHCAKIAVLHVLKGDFK